MKRLIALTVFLLLGLVQAQPNLLPDIYLAREIEGKNVCFINTAFYNPESLDAELYPDWIKSRPDKNGVQWLNISELEVLHTIMNQKLEVVAADPECEQVGFTHIGLYRMPGLQELDLDHELRYTYMLAQLAQQKGLKVFMPPAEGPPA